MVDPAHDRAVYSISVASELTGVNPQMLRTYENKGLLAPFRTEGGTRRYSGHDVERIGQITTLLASGLNLAGVEHVLRLRAETERLQATIDRLRRLPGTPKGSPGATSSGRTARTPRRT